MCLRKCARVCVFVQSPSVARALATRLRARACNCLEMQTYQDCTFVCVLAGRSLSPTFDCVVEPNRRPNLVIVVCNCVVLHERTRETYLEHQSICARVHTHTHIKFERAYWSGLLEYTHFRFPRFRCLPATNQPNALARVQYSRERAIKSAPTIIHAFRGELFNCIQTLRRTLQLLTCLLARSLARFLCR